MLCYHFGMQARSTVLFVDDDPTARRVYGMFLTAAGFEVDEATSGLEAVARVEARAHDVVVMDLDMPGLDGWMAMSLIRARRPELPIVILSAMQDQDLRDRAEKAQAAGFLSKPCSQDTIARTVSRAIAKHK
jgi:CheY-like chemotaxis protein